jgi:O-antigen chain-terminating methyltransferase
MPVEIVMTDDQRKTAAGIPAEYFPPSTSEAIATRIDDLVRHNQESMYTLKNKAVTGQNERLDAYITEAAARAHVGEKVPPMLRFPEPLRRVALFAGRVVRYLARFITEDQSACNVQVVKALQLVRDQLAERETALHNLRMTVASQARTITQLKERLLAGGMAAEDAAPSGCEESCGMEDIGDEAFYLALEDRFRGSRDEIKERLRANLTYIRKAGAGTSDRPLLDLGCGRGEWLEILREEGIAARGIDQSRQMINCCLSRGLSVSHGDVIDCLREIPDNSFGAVTAFQVVEHLSFESLRELLIECHRVLLPGGVAIFETPNPGNVLVGANNYYFDPTHCKPLPSLLLQFTLEYHGFADVLVEYRSVECVPLPEDASESDRRMHDALLGPMEYAVIGWRS